MSMPFYVAPEQMMKDRADYARKGIARGRSLTALTYQDGILIVAENPSNTLRKVSEIYGGVGRYNEYDQLRVAGVRAADLKGYSYSRDDVDARSLANQYSQILGQIFTHEVKPMEVEILIAEVREQPAADQMFHVLYDVKEKVQIPSITFWYSTGGSTSERGRDSATPHVRAVSDRDNDTIIMAPDGGDSEVINGRVGQTWSEGLSLRDAVRVAVGALAGPDRTLGPGDLEVAMLARSNGRRAFRRLDDNQVAEHLS